MLTCLHLIIANLRCLISRYHSPLISIWFYHQVTWHYCLDFAIPSHHWISASICQFWWCPGNSTYSCCLQWLCYYLVRFTVWILCRSHYHLWSKTPYSIGCLLLPQMEFITKPFYWVSASASCLFVIGSSLRNCDLWCCSRCQQLLLRHLSQSLLSLLVLTLLWVKQILNYIV